ncbi:MAG TPA: imidazole glycerol phosphate synthase subunit HisH [Actinomycetes bacterium]|jgi:glutamine amidotransferase|nr:imidazole glycerol phosphate synthase subunit HisH [Actinomycetes bacterium]
MSAAPTSTASKVNVVVLDYGSGNVRSACRALERAGAAVRLSADRDAALHADGLVVPGVGAFAACINGLDAVNAREIVGRRLAGGLGVLGICVGMQVMFEVGVEHGVRTQGFEEWPGAVELLDAEVLPHMGWNTVTAPSQSVLFRGIEHERFYFVHSYGVQRWDWIPGGPLAEPLVTWTAHDRPFISAVEHGPLSATQFHPEKSGEAGHVLLRNWLSTL